MENWNLCGPYYNLSSLLGQGSAEASSSRPDVPRRRQLGHVQRPWRVRGAQGRQGEEEVSKTTALKALFVVKREKGKEEVTHSNSGSSK